MRYEEFRKRAHEVFDEIPDEFRAGVEGLEVTRKTVLHPTLPEVYTMGECLSEFYPSEYGGAGEVRSRVVLYYGSFQAVARDEDTWDWDDEIWETITHEIRHHLEHLASDDELEERDFAADQLFAMREGGPFDPFFFRSGEPVGGGAFEVEGDIFIEVEVERGPGGSRLSVVPPTSGASIQVTLPDDLGDVHFLRIADPPGDAPGDLFIVAVTRKSMTGWIRGILKQASPRVLHDEVTWERNDATV